MEIETNPRPPGCPNKPQPAEAQGAGELAEVENSKPSQIGWTTNMLPIKLAFSTINPLGTAPKESLHLVAQTLLDAFRHVDGR